MVGMPTDRKERNVEAIAENGEKWGQEEGKRKNKKSRDKRAGQERPRTAGVTEMKYSDA